jgi:fatty acid CoA ligase FadD9
VTPDPLDPASWTPPGASVPRPSRFAPLPGVAPTSVENVASAKWTRQSSVAEPRSAAFARATLAEASPWWSIDLAADVAIERLVLAVDPSPRGTRVRVCSYTYAAKGEDPPHNAPHVELPLESFTPQPDGSLSITLELDWVARFVRVELALDGQTPLTLRMRDLVIDAHPLFSDTLRASYARAFSRFADRTLFSRRAVPGEGPFAPTHTYRELWTLSRALAAGLARRLEPASGDRESANRLTPEPERGALRRGLHSKPLEQERGGVFDDRATRGPGAPEPPSARLGARRERVFLGVILGHRAEWLAAELAAVERGYVMVPLAPDDADERLDAILARCPLDAAIVDAASAERLRSHPDRPRLLLDVDRSPAEILRLGDEAIVSWQALIEESEAPVPPRAPREEGDLHTLIFTSGSTGAPKGAMRSYARFHQVIATYGAGQPARHLSFQPLSHLSERNYLPAAVIHGAHVGLSSGPAHVLSDLEAFEPTWISSVPRLFEAVRAIVASEVQAAEAAQGTPASRDEIVTQVLARTRARFGRNLQGVAVGSAPVSDELFAFLERLFAGLWVLQGYGSTEVGTITGNLVPTAGVALKIEPVEELGPSPEGCERGELWVRSPHVIDGYFGDAEATARQLDAEGFFRTGDLVERTIADGRVRVIGRRSHSVKLASGEFVALDRVEAVLASAPWIEHVFVTLTHDRCALAAVIVPREAALRAELQEHARAPWPALCDDADARAAALRSLGEHAARGGLTAREIPRALLLEPEPFTIASGLLTTSQKLARHAAEARFRARLDALAAPSDVGTARGASTDDPLARALSAVASVVGRAVSADEPLEGLAGDSLTSAELVAAIGAALRREVSLRAWAAAPTLRALLGGADRDRGSDDALRARLREDAARALPAERRRRTERHPPGAVLLTGATGLLGAHVLEALLSGTDAHVVCLVRAESGARATERLAATLARFEIPSSFEGRVRCVTSLAEVTPKDSLDAIVHAAAAVNWLSRYEAVRASNVLLTADVLALAASHGAVLHHVSTVSTAPSRGDEDSFLSLEDAASQSGYGASKWVAEALVRRAARELELPACVHRPGLVVGHASRGIGNGDDFVHRYLAACVRYGVCLDEDAILDMTPVDYVARAIVCALLDPSRGSHDASRASSEASSGRVLHLNNVRGSLTFAAIGRELAALGVPCELLDHARFRERAVLPAESPLRPLAGFFPEAGFFLGSGPWPDAKSRAWLEARGVSCPIVDRALLARTLRGADLLPRA